MSENQEWLVWDDVANVLLSKVSSAEKALLQYEIERDCRQEMVKVYERHGQQPPWTYGAGRSDSSLELEILYEREQVRRWTEAHALVVAKKKSLEARL